jgi:LPXTG-motif cell wall-anchored protein
VTFLLFTGASAAHAADDDPDAAGTGGGAMVITVVVPDHTAAPSPSPTPPQEHTGALPATGDDLQQLLPWLLGGLAATSLGGVLVARRRRA